MAFDPKPSTWLGAGYTVDTGAHTISMTTLTAGSDIVLHQLTDALADETTGDIRSVAMAVSEALFQAWQGQAPADRPAKMTLSRTTSTGTSSATVFTYTFKFTVDPTEITIPSE